MIRRLLLKAAYPFLKKAGKFHSPWSHKIMTEEFIESILINATPGDIVLAHTRGEFTNICIPGFWKHAAIFSEEMNLIEAVDPKVREVGPIDFFMRKDYIAVVRPVGIPTNVCLAAARYAETLLDKPYDYQFDMPVDKPNEAFYCAELPYWAYMNVAGRDFKFELREILGVRTVKPEDYWLASKHFSHIWSNSPIIPN